MIVAFVRGTIITGPFSSWCRHADEVYVEINGEWHNLWPPPTTTPDPASAKEDIDKMASKCYVISSQKWINGFEMTGPATTARPKRKGNYKPGPGRPKGRKNNKTLALEEAARKAAASIDGAFEGDAHAFLQAVYRNPDVPLEIRIMAAGRALRVEKPVLSATQSRVDIHVGIAQKLQAAQDRLHQARALAASGPMSAIEVKGPMTVEGQVEVAGTNRDADGRP